MKATTYGQRGGTGPTKDKKFVTYRGVFPDGNTFSKRTLQAQGDKAQAAIYYFAGHPGDGVQATGWFCAAVYDVLPEWADRYQWIEVTR